MSNKLFSLAKKFEIKLAQQNLQTNQLNSNEKSINERMDQILTILAGIEGRAMYIKKPSSIATDMVNKIRNAQSQSPEESKYLNSFITEYAKPVLTSIARDANTALEIINSLSNNT